MMMNVLKWVAKGFSGSLKKGQGCLKAISLWLILGVPFAHAAPRIATSDWATAETLAAIGHAPVSLGDKRAYRDWVNYPSMPAHTQDAGLRFQPNLAHLYRVKPDFFVQSPWFAFLKPQFERIAPVHEIQFANEQGITYPQVLAATRKLGQIVGDTAAAEKLIRQTDETLFQAAQTLAPYRQRPVAVVQFVDARHLRIYGKTSLFQVVLDKLSLNNAWTGASNQWGFAPIALSDLSQLPPQTLLIIVQPHPINVRPNLAKSALWQRLPFSQTQHRRVLPPSWSYGALPSMQQFARLLAEKLPSEKEMPW
ncbi:ABC transporter substrate-binding protein [Alysiella filiformis]|nr:ABC transporter substrate-binding protein [Alysiella filiformis]UBQ56973.1 ABC transporter substrate-binding protein [Alysiella filiformis DSM 16848]